MKRISQAVALQYMSFYLKKAKIDLIFPFSDIPGLSKSFLSVDTAVTLHFQHNLVHKMKTPR